MKILTLSSYQEGEVLNKDDRMGARGYNYYLPSTEPKSKPNQRRKKVNKDHSYCFSDHVANNPLIINRMNNNGSLNNSRLDESKNSEIITPKYARFESKTANLDQSSGSAMNGVSSFVSKVDNQESNHSFTGDKNSKYRLNAKLPEFESENDRIEFDVIVKNKRDDQWNLSKSKNSESSLFAGVHKTAGHIHRNNGHQMFPSKYFTFYLYSN